MSILPILFGLWFFLIPGIEAAAERFIQPVLYSATVLNGEPTGPMKAPGYFSVSAESILLAFGTALLAVLIALSDPLASGFRPPIQFRYRRAAEAVTRASQWRLQRLRRLDRDWSNNLWRRHGLGAPLMPTAIMALSDGPR